jgi:hypothetical protein
VNLLIVKWTLRTPGVAAIVHILRDGDGGAGLRGQALVDQPAEGRELVVK